ncbi:hypothetical protein E0Z10_g8644 [Xylaria hypoxylon]|uniref:Yeast cell wall synthesis Kre9/Knh1-like N-terminal domain-containing protein n=1 Tax=Xylaria hypoxylon TaxID=37992 RepID=A0A4Z0YMD3_9PEZI|nr:hypothetical protein E0Z10_g8644 [Xylaria hypoxylon]
MAPLQKLALLSLSGIACSQGTNFVEFLAPHKNEVVAADTAYVIKWAPKSSTGNGTMSLLAGQTSETMSKIWEIACEMSSICLNDLIDVANGSFSWPVTSPTLAQSSNFYALNFSLDGSEGTFDISPPFKIAFEAIRGRNDPSDDHQGGQVTNVSRDKGQGSGTITPTTMLTSRKFSDKSTNRNQGTPVFDMSSLTTSSMTGLAERVPISSNNDKDAGNNSSSKRSNLNGDIIVNDSSGLISGLDSTTELSTGAVVGIVIGAATALAIFSSLIWLVFYYRRKSLKKVHCPVKSTCQPKKSPCSKGNCQSKAVDVACPHMRMARMYELNATREIQEADGNMKPAELDSTVPKFKSSAVDVERNIIYR